MGRMDRRPKEICYTGCVDLIVSHTNADFDALASMVAASLLYPTGVMSLPGGADRNVREFLALHGDVIKLLSPHDIALDAVTRLIIVETQHARRLGPFAALIGRPGVEVVLYDHHTPNHPTVHADTNILAPYGANTTLMVELLRQQQISVNALQATLFALGIYEDTGSLTFSATTPEDAETVAWLLRQGANLDMISAFINRALSEGQRHVLNQLLASAVVERVQGIHVLLATACAEGYPDDIALLAHRMRELESSDAVVLLVQIADDVQLVARSSVDAVSAATIARHFDGGGHARAASATIHHRTVETVRNELCDVLPSMIQPLVTAATLMSFPVRTIPSDTTIDEAAKLMLRYGHGGLTVVEHDQVVGIIARREVDRARHHNLGHAPVRGYMMRRVIPITPTTPLPEIERLMIEHNLGRFPVLDQGRLVGIVTRTDVLRAIHGERYRDRHTLYHARGAMRNLWAVYEARIPAEHQALLAHIADLASELGLTIFLVGGVVRDLLLRNPNSDLDILVEGEGIPLAERVAQEVGGRVVSHAKFHTATVTVPNGVSFDFATARTEFYQYPAALPTAEHSSVREDLYRRDFTINAMAMQLNGDAPGRVLDPFGGSQDLAERTIRVLHALSFVEDPTRILRAVRFEARFAFHMDERTEELARQAVAMELIGRVSGDRVREELLQLFASVAPDVGLRRLQELGVLQALEPTWQVPACTPEYAQLDAVLAWAQHESVVASHLIDPVQQRLLLIFAHLRPEAAARLIARLRLPTKLANLARQLPTLWPRLPALADPDLRPGDVEDVLRNMPVPLALALMALAPDDMARGYIQTYFTVWHLIPPLMDGEDVKALGVPRGPVYTRIMRAVRAAQLDGTVTTHDDALAMAREIVART